MQVKSYKPHASTDLHIPQLYNKNCPRNSTDLDFVYSYISTSWKITMLIVCASWLLEGERSQEMGLCKHLTSWSEDNRDEYQNCRSHYSVCKRSLRKTIHFCKITQNRSVRMSFGIFVTAEYFGQFGLQKDLNYWAKYTVDSCYTTN